MKERWLENGQANAHLQWIKNFSNVRLLGNFVTEYKYDINFLSERVINNFLWMCLRNTIDAEKEFAKKRDCLLTGQKKPSISMTRVFHNLRHKSNRV